ncbi:hypothetical protein D9M68_845550 [compost metagenome]
MKRMIFGVLLLPCLASAEESAKSETEHWLEVQRSSEQASAIVQRATPAERELSYQRWLESFRLAIPQWFFSDDQGSSGMSGK